jgi:hypothetical protein
MIAGSDDAAKRTIASEKKAIGPLSRTEYCGLICKCKDEFKPTAAHPGVAPVLYSKEVLVETSGAGGRPQFNYQKMWIIKSATVCDPFAAKCNQFGKEWKVAGAYHSHPSNSTFSRGADESYIKPEIGLGLGLGTPDGKVQLLTEGGKVVTLRDASQPENP